MSKKKIVVFDTGPGKHELPAELKRRGFVVTTVSNLRRFELIVTKKEVPKLIIIVDRKQGNADNAVEAFWNRPHTAKVNGIPFWAVFVAESPPTSSKESAADLSQRRSDNNAWCERMKQSGFARAAVIDDASSIQQLAEALQQQLW